MLAYSTDWTNPTWLASAHTWIADVAAHQGRTITSPITQPHVRPWSTVLRVPTDAGDWYFKAVAPVLINEIPLTNALWHLRPHATLPVIAIDRAHGWMLMPDGGLRLREIIRQDPDMRHWEHPLASYAQTQLALVPFVSDMLAFGTPDYRLSLLPRHYEDVLAAVPALEVESDDRLSATELHQLQQLSQRVRDLCMELTTYPIPMTLNHGDVHDGNIFIRDGQPRFFDWGDASVTHPFVSLRTVFVSVEITFDMPEGSGAGLPLRDAYLEPWLSCAPYADVLTAFQLAQRIAPLISAFNWYRVVAPLQETQRREQGVAVHHLLREFLDTERQWRD